MKRLAFATVLSLLFAWGCSKYEVQYEGPYQDETDKTPVASGIKYEILTVENGRIRLYHRNLVYVKTLDNLPTGIQKAAINYAHDRIAYQVPGQNIVVVDTVGTLLGTVSNSTGAIWFDWHANNQSLCILTGFNLSFWGPPVSVAATNLTSLFPSGSSDREMFCATATADGGIVAAYRYYTFSQGYQNRITVLAPDGTPWHVPLGAYSAPWLRADQSGTNILYAQQNAATTPRIWQIEVTSRQNREYSSGTIGAVAPQGNRIASWNSGALRVYNPSTNEWFEFQTGAVTMSAMDW